MAYHMPAVAAMASGDVNAARTRGSQALSTWKRRRPRQSKVVHEAHASEVRGLACLNPATQRALVWGPGPVGSKGSKGERLQVLQTARDVDAARTRGSQAVSTW